jgi:hypothetical protein
VVYHYMTIRCMCMALRPFEVLRILLREGEDPFRILEAINHMVESTWDRLELLIGLWLKRPGLKGIGQRSLQLGIHPVSLPLFLPAMESCLPLGSTGTSKGALACRVNDLVLSLADALGVRADFLTFQQGRSPGFQQSEVDMKGPGRSRILLPGLKFSYSISIEGDPALETIPPGLELGQSLRVKDCPNLRSVPDDLRVGRDLRLQMLPDLQKLPEALEISGHLALSGPGILEVLPRSITCGGNLCLEVDLARPGSLEKLQVQGSARISALNLVSLPKGTRIGGRLQLFDCPHLESLPEGIQVCGDLIIRGCPSLTHLGSGVQVGGTLHLETPCPLWDRLEPGTDLPFRTVISHIDRLRI